MKAPCEVPAPAPAGDPRTAAREAVFHLPTARLRPPVTGAKQRLAD